MESEAGDESVDYGKSAVSTNVESAVEDQAQAVNGHSAPLSQHSIPDAPRNKIDSLQPQPQRIVAPEKGPNVHLSEDEAAILQKQTEAPLPRINYLSLYRFATRIDIVIMIISSTCAVAAGAALPLMTIVFGSLAGTFQGFFNGSATTGFDGKVDHLTLYFVYLGIAEFVTAYTATVGFIYVGEHISRKIREQYLASILRQNIGYFDKLGAGEITTRITADTNLVQDGISGKVGLTLTAVSTFVTAYIIGYVKYWKLTLILTSTIVAIMLTTGGLSRFIIKWGKKSLASYAQGGSLAEEVISSIRNAVAFGTQDKLAKEYEAHLSVAERYGFRMKSITGSMIGVLMFYLYLTYALGFWLGGHYITNGECTLADVLTILLSIMIGAFSLGNVSPNIQAFTAAVAAASKIYATIDRTSPLDPRSNQGRRLKTVRGDVQFRNVKHIYPSRPEVTAIEDVNLIMPGGRTTALVGASGSGKSTIIGIIERFYIPVRGEVMLDGVNIDGLNLRWLRQNISLVSQEPTLFATTIAGNIRHGLIGTGHENSPQAQTRELIENAAKMSNAHDFICQLPRGYETNVGERGFLLSGGQKQRIAIARAIVSDPKILLLDEATSALDTKSEGVVQAALERASEGRTTIIIAHRLSTIKGADNIIVMSQGHVVEQGTHNQLLDKKAAYYELVEAQKLTKARVKLEQSETQILDEEDGFLPTPTEEKRGANRGTYTEDMGLGRIRSKHPVWRKASAKKETKRVSTFSLSSLTHFVLSFNVSEWPLMVLGLVFAIICGSGQPTQSVFFAKSIQALSLPPPRYGELRSEIDFWSWMYLMLALASLLAYVSQGLIFAYCSEKLIYRARDRSFRMMLRQDITFFDQIENSAGALTSFLSTEVTHLAGMSGVTLGTILLVSTTLVAGFTVALAIGWKLALVCIAAVPVILACGFFRIYMLARFQEHTQKAYADSAAFACEATSAIRTVTSLMREDDIWKQYHLQLLQQSSKSIRSILQSSLLYAASQSFMFLCIALGFWYGGRLIGNGEYNVFQFFLCFQAVIFGAQAAGTIFSFAPDIGKAKHAASEMKSLFDLKPKIDTWNSDGQLIESIQGHIELRNVHFRYPTRPEQPVLSGMDLDVRPGQYIALVGPSGCGKSTTIALLERFYDPDAGGIYIDGLEIRSLNVNSYRSKFALVSQEPTLYQGTVRENILLGANKKAEDVPEEAIIQVCKDANIYDFILSLPEGFDTVVGSKGIMLSGGQKQRIAIARALLRDPKVLLLDEATSALDSESEKVVQAALDVAAKDRTTIAVAHRLSSIQKADLICVFDQGRIVERGTHSELFLQRGKYFELVNLQNLGERQ